MVELKYRVVSSLILLVLDFMWLGGFMAPRYSVMIKNIQGSPMKANMLYAVLSYLLMIVGLQQFVLPNLDFKNITVKDCLKYGFVFGLVVYGVYDFTAGAVIKNWDMNLAFVDVLWGGTVYFLSCYLLKFV
tara:strand:+ start:3303 stop:3695 length:393 start_codon:yes stop_codon:yes gene_type:complete